MGSSAPEAGYAMAARVLQQAMITIGVGKNSRRSQTAATGSGHKWGYSDGLLAIQSNL
jgi:hypothetical protein